MKKKYFVKYYGFHNCYDLVYTKSEKEAADAVAHGFERISRKEAERLCRMERDRRKYDPAFSGYANDHIWPYAEEEELWESGRYDYDGYLIIGR